MMAEGPNFGAAEAAANGEQVAGGAGNGTIVAGFWYFRLFKRREESNLKVFRRRVKNGQFVRYAWSFGAKKQVWISNEKGSHWLLKMRAAHATSEHPNGRRLSCASSWESLTSEHL